MWRAFPCDPGRLRRGTLPVQLPPWADPRPSSEPRAKTGWPQPDASLRGHLAPRLTGRAARLSSTPTLRTHSWSAPTGARRAPRALEDVKKLLLAVDWQSKAQVRAAFRTRRVATRTPTPSGTLAPRSGRAAPARTRPAAQPPDPAPGGFHGTAGLPGGCPAWAMPRHERTAHRRAVTHAAVPSCGFGCPAPLVIRLGRLLAM